MAKYFLDTNVYDKLISLHVDISHLKSKDNYYSSNVQLSELKNIKDLSKRASLLKVYNDLSPDKLLLKSGIWLDDLYWDDDQPWTDDIGQTAKDLAGDSTKKWKDALIGEIAKLNSLILVSGDIAFLNKASGLGIQTMTTDIFVETVTKQ